MKALLAEYIGTFAIVFFGTGAIILNDVTGNSITNFGIALSFGLTVMLMILAFDKKSGAHFNPGVSLSLAISGDFSFRNFPAHIISQFAGAISASLILRVIFPLHDKLGSSLPSGTGAQAGILEFLLTMALVIVIYLAITFNKLPFVVKAAMIGGTVFLEAYFAGPYCGASMNPARSLGPAVVSGHTEFLGIYLLATFSGGILPAVVKRLLKGKQ